MPIDLRIYENFPEAVARYKHFDLLMVNSIFDGMNLVAKEAPLVNTRDGVLMLSENTGAHEELADCALSVNPFDIQEQSDAIYRALTMDPEERRLRAERLRQIIAPATPATGSTSSWPTSTRCAKAGPPPARRRRPRPSGARTPRHRRLGAAVAMVPRARMGAERAWAPGAKRSRVVGALREPGPWGAAAAGPRFLLNPMAGMAGEATP